MLGCSNTHHDMKLPHSVSLQRLVTGIYLHTFSGTPACNHQFGQFRPYRSADRSRCSTGRLSWKMVRREEKWVNILAHVEFLKVSGVGGFNFTSDWIHNFKEYVSIFAVLRVLQADEWVVRVMVSLSILGAIFRKFIRKPRFSCQATIEPDEVYSTWPQLKMAVGAPQKSFSVPRCEVERWGRTDSPKSKSQFPPLEWIPFFERGFLWGPILGRT